MPKYNRDQSEAHIREYLELVSALLKLDGHVKSARFLRIEDWVWT